MPSYLLKNKSQAWISLIALVLVTNCTPQETYTPPLAPTELSRTSTATPIPTDQTTATIPASMTEEPTMTQSQFADVLSVRVTGNPGAYQFAVGISSPDTGCNQYADWWEVFTEDGQLLYRRVLLHSHVGEQPFVRSGGPVNIDSSAVVYVRGHMNTVGYGDKMLMGTVQDGFKPVEAEEGFGADLERVSPLPEDCAF